MIVTNVCALITQSFVFEIYMFKTNVFSKDWQNALSTRLCFIL